MAPFFNNGNAKSVDAGPRASLKDQVPGRLLPNDGGESTGRSVNRRQSLSR